MVKQEINARFAGSMLGTENALRVYLLTGNGSIHELLAGFFDLHSFETALGDINLLDPDNLLIAETYWIGNNSLNNVPTDPEILLKHYRLSKPQGYVDALKKKLPQKIILHHNFMVPWIGVSETKNQTQWLSLVNSCWVRGGMVTEIDNKSVTLDSFHLYRTGVHYQLGYAPQIVSWDQELLPDLKPGSFLATHGNIAAMQLNPDQMRQLLYCTQEITQEL